MWWRRRPKVYIGPCRRGRDLEWHRRRDKVHSSVVVARSGSTTRFFAAHWGVGVFHSTNGTNWTATGTAFPASGVGRIALAVKADNPNLIYAFVINGSGGTETAFTAWTAWAAYGRKLPICRTSFRLTRAVVEGNYDVAIAVDPQNENLLYLGGSHSGSPPWSGSIWRCPVQATASGFKFNGAASIGIHAHADVHVLQLSPGDSDELWCGCDGGIFLNRAPRGAGQFAGMNSLACLCSNFVGQDPSDPGVIFTGLQDNGTARTGGGPEWKHVNFGDGGYCLVNWDDPSVYCPFANGRVFRSTSGGKSHGDWAQSGILDGRR